MLSRQAFVFDSYLHGISLLGITGQLKAQFLLLCKNCIDKHTLSKARVHAKIGLPRVKLFLVRRPCSLLALAYICLPNAVITQTALRRSSQTKA